MPYKVRTLVPPTHYSVPHSSRVDAKEKSVFVGQIQTDLFPALPLLQHPGVLVWLQPHYHI